MMAFKHWLSMGGYYFYVWSAYGLTAMIFLINSLAIKRHREGLKKKLLQWYKRQEQ